MRGMMRVGYGVSELTVPTGTPMGGYAFREGRSAGTLDSLRITALTWYDGTHRAAVVLTDLICVNADLTRAVRAAVPEVDVLWLAASHTHAGPDTGCVPGGADTPAEWLEPVTAGVAEAVDRARVAEAGAAGQVRTGKLHGVGAVRSRVVSAADVPLDVIEVKTAGRRAGLLVVLPVHPTVLPPGNLLVSADLTGAVRTALEARLGDEVWVAVATGAAGDISTRHTRQGQDPAELARLGELVAGRCLELLAGPAVEAWPEDSVLSWRSRTLELTPKPAEDGQALVAAAVAELERSDDPVAARIAAGNLDGARLAAETALATTTVIEAEVAALRIDRLMLAALPGEPFLAMAEGLRRQRIGPTAVLGYANAYPGYLPPAGEYGQATYEVLAAAVAAGSAERVARTAAELVRALETSSGVVAGTVIGGQA